MASEPINIFSREVQPAAVLEAVTSRYPAAEVVGAGADWREITVRFGKGKKAKSLALMHDPDYYAGDDWPRQMNGMQGYFSRFPADPDLMRRILDLIGTFTFSLATRFDPDYDDPSTDERFAIVSGVTRLLDGVLFTPSSLRDPDGRVLIDADGESDPEATWPKVRATRPAVPDEVLAAGEDGPDPPTPQRVARRAVALMAVTGRAVVEREFRSKNYSAEDADRVLGDLREWVTDLDVWDEFEPAEAEALEAKPGKLTDRRFTDSMWRIEGLEVLGWALGRTELPRYDEISNVDDVWAGLGFRSTRAAGELLAAPTLRSMDKLQAFRKQMLGFHWRLREWFVRPKKMDFRAFAADCWFGSFDVSAFDLIDDELALRGHRLDEVPDDVIGVANGIALERHLAINWLCYGPAVYSETYVGT
jgi:hypothetical protein